MINIVLAMAGKSTFFNENEYFYPKPLIEIGNKTMIQLVIEYLDTIKDEKKFIFILNREDCAKFHLDNILRLLTNNQCEIVVLERPTKGAACSVLMAIEYINNEEELIVANADQIFKIDINDPINSFRKKMLDAGVICFETVHPRWSFARVDNQNKIIETAEKRPISKNAIAGFYYFKTGSIFISAAMKSIKRDASVNASFYVAPVLNELVLEGKNMEIYPIKNNDYQTFYTPQKINEYESKR